jgi:hypothetical protein
MCRPLLLLACLSLALPLSAAYSGQDLVLPVAGSSAGAGGRLFDTTLWITNLSLRHPAEVTLAFYQSGQTNRSPRTIAVRIGPGQTWVTDTIGSALTGGAAMGAIRVHSTQEVIASARTYSRLVGETNAAAVASAFAAIPTQFAIGNDEETTLQGITPADSRYKVYLVEVTGQPLAVTLQILDPAGSIVAEARRYVDAHMQIGADLHELFNDKVVPAHALLRIAGTNGEGRVVVAGAQIASQSQDASAYEMTFRTQPRNRMTIGEIVAYTLVAIAVLAAALLRRRVKSEE